MKKRRFLPLVLVCALLCALVLPVGAAATPKLTYTQSGSTLRLKLQELGQESIYGVQLELTFQGQCASAVLTPPSAAAYAPPCTCTQTEDATQVTVYLTSQTSLSQKGALDMGTLTLSASLPMPTSAKLTLLGRDLQPLAEAQTVSVSRQSTSGSSSGSSSSGSGSLRPSPSPSPTPAPTPTPTPQPELPFTDVAERDWFYQEVKFVQEKGMMSGTSDTTFSPNTPTSRAMIVTVLYRLADSPPALSPTFSDVPPHRYYTDPVGWAAAQSIVNGYETGLFQPDGLLTREQMAAVLYRYSRAMGYDTSARGDLTRFADRSAISAYAVEPMSWAVGVGLLSGMGDGSLSPKGQATRAQLATILTRFYNKVAFPPQGV